MTPIEQQVCSLELARKLKELGVRQESYFYYNEHNFLINRDDVYEYYDCCAEDMKGYISAFTVVELGEMLPKSIYCETSQKEYFLKIEKDDMSEEGQIEGWLVRYSGFFNKETLVHCLRENFNCALAEILIYLIENGYVKAEEL